MRKHPRRIIKSEKSHNFCPRVPSSSSRAPLVDVNFLLLVLDAKIPNLKSWFYCFSLRTAALEEAKKIIQSQIIVSSSHRNLFPVSSQASVKCFKDEEGAEIRTSEKLRQIWSRHFLFFNNIALSSTFPCRCRQSRRQPEKGWIMEIWTWIIFHQLESLISLWHIYRLCISETITTMESSDRMVHGWLWERSSARLLAFLIAVISFLFWFLAFALGSIACWITFAFWFMKISARFSC